MSSQPARSVDEIRVKLLADVRHCAASVRSMAWLRAVLTWLTVVLLALTLLLIIDFALRREEAGLRVLSLVALLTVLVVSARKFLRPLLGFRPTPLQLARWVEDQRPDLGRRLSTAVEISAIDPQENRYGSRSFQEAVLRAWNAEPRKPNLQAYLDSRQVWKAAGLLAVVCTMLGLGGALRPVETKLALMRLAAPWASHAWPRRDQLEFIELPSVVGIGSEVQLEISDRNPPFPAEVSLLVRREGDDSHILRLPTKQLDSIAIGDLPSMESAVEVRAVGGDDQHMPWQRIDVVTPPRLAEFHFEITPPEYANIPPSELVGNRIQVLAGSAVRFYGRLNESIKSVALAISKDAIPGSGDAGWDVQLAADERSISIGGPDGVSLSQSLNWRFVFVTTEGLRIEPSQVWSVEVIADEPPNVSLTPLAMNRMASDASVQLNGRAQDDLRLIDVQAWASLEGDDLNQAVNLLVWSSNDSVEREMEVDHLWDIARRVAEQVNHGKPPTGQETVKQLAQGQVLTFWLEARDSRGQIGRSQTERVEVQSAENILAEVLDRQSDLLGRMRELVESQRRNALLAEQASGRLSDSRPVSQQDVDSFVGVSELQRAIADGLSGGGASIVQEVRSLRRILQWNHLEGLPADEQLRKLEQEIESIATGAMRAATENAAAVQMGVRERFVNGGPAEESTISQANESNQSQMAVLEALLALTDRVDRSGALQQMQREFSNVATQQDLLQKEVEALQRDSLNGASTDEVLLRKRELSREQLGLAQGLDGLIARTRELIAASGDESSELVGQLGDAIGVLTEGQASRLMRQATDQIEAKQFASASQNQEKVSRILSDAIRKMRSPTNPASNANLEAREESLREASRELSTLANAETRLAEQMSRPDAGARAGELAAKQTNLRQDTTRQADAAEANGDMRSADAIRDAADEQNAAEQSANQSQMQQAAAAAQRAAERLEDEAKQLERQADALERQSQQLQLDRLGANLVRLTREQQAVVDQLAALAENSDQVSGFEAQSRQVATEQEAIRQLLNEVRRQSDKLPTFEWTLEQVDLDMARAVAAAQRYRIDPDALTAATDALIKLELASEATESIPPQPTEQGNSDPQDSPNAEPSTPFPPLASLRLLRALQNQINEQTELAEAEPDPSRSKKRLTELSQQQKQLGEQLGQLLQELNE